jgi:serine/threonine protein phosphatase 1
MIQSIRQFFGLAPSKRGPAVPAGQRVYAVGDIHGRLDLFDAMIAAIERDDAAGVPARTTVVLLGDLVDRGPDSAGVVARAREWGKRRPIRILCGNHEEMFLASFDNREVLRHFLQFGGRETLASYGIEADPHKKKDYKALQELMRSNVPEDDLRFLSQLEDFVIIGGYAFVHAGILPEVPIASQSPQDLRWIREPFLSFAEPHSHVVVHGHTVYDEAELRENRLGIDTGAFSSGRLTALVLEGTGRRLIQTQVRHGVVSTFARKVEAEEA